MNNTPRHFDAVFISDLHLGNAFVDVTLLRNFLDAIRPRTDVLYLVGDIFDAWRHCNPSDFIELFQGFKKIVFIRGNHDCQFAGPSNPLPTPAIDGEKMTWNGRSGVVTHAQIFDANFDKASRWAVFTDTLIYWFSRLIRLDVKKHLGAIGRNYSDRIEKSCCTISRVFAEDFVIIGHTHYGGERVVGEVKLFNLGSWLTDPFALFKSGDDYVFRKITADALLPASEEFRKFF